MKKTNLLSLALAAVLIIHTIPPVLVLAAPDTAAAADTSAADTDAIADTDAGTDADAATDADAVTEYIYINTADEFLNFAHKCYQDSWSANKTVILEQDIDLTGTSFDMVPVFAGVFDGNGHTIQGFRPVDQGYIVGLFRYIREGGMVQDLTLKGNIQAVNEKECIGSICGVNYGTIKNCRFSGIVNGQNTVGGIAGSNEAGGSITKCTSSGHIMGYYSTGGIAGINHGIITSCNNEAGINDNSSWVQEDDEIGAGLFFNIQATDDGVELYSGVDTGGIAGYSNGLIERCNNNGRVGYEHTGYNIGGIVGRQSGTVMLCTNSGTIYGRKDVGGIAGQMEPDIEVDEAASLRNAVNKLHDLIDKTIDDMQSGKSAIKTDLDNLSMYGDGALTSGDAVAGDLTDFVDDNIEQAQAVTQRMEHIMDVLPEILDDMADCGDSFARLNDTVGQLMQSLDYSEALNSNAYNGTDYNRITLLSTVGGQIAAEPLWPAAGETVTITVTPDSDADNGSYQLADGSLQVVTADGSTPVEITADPGNAGTPGSTAKYTFTMPEANVKVNAAFTFLSAGSASVSVKLSSNPSGNASYTVDNASSTATLSITPDTGYTIGGVTAVDNDGSGSPLAVTQVSDTQYQFSTDSITSPVAVNIVFNRQTQQSALDTSVDNIKVSMQELKDCSERINNTMQEIKSLDPSNPSDRTKIEELINDSTPDMQLMLSSSATVLSELGSVYNILDPYMQDAVDAARESISQATGQVQNMLAALRRAYGSIRGIVGYVSAQSDLQFATLGAEFDNDREMLHYQLLGISDSLKSLSSSAYQYSDQVNEDLRAVNDQLNVVFNLLADHLTNASDLSVEELYEEVDEDEIDSVMTGRVDSCTNNGIIKGDINIGGIAGSMSVDEEDPEDNAAGNIDYQVGRRFITKCIIAHGVNNGYITAKKDGAGGIVGYMEHGIATGCESYGSAESTEGGYVGGIAGESLTQINQCYSLCSVSGGKDIGGIAGYGSTIKDCRAIVSVEASIGQKGAIAGEVASLNDDCVSANYYVDDDLFGIDNISYAGIAQPVTYQELLTTKFLPARFWHLTVTYRVEDTYLGTQEVPFGESLSVLNYPKIPEKEGCYGVWPDYSDRVMTGNLLIEGNYEDIVTVVESSEKEDPAEENLSAIWQKPYALVEEAFTQDTVLNVTVSDRIPPDEAQGRDHVIYDVTLEKGDIDAKETFAIRLLNPYENDVQVYGFIDDGWTKLDGKTRGQYIQVEMTGPEESFCIVAARSFPWIAVVIAAVGAAVLFLAVRLSRRAKKKLAGAHQAPQMK